MIDTAKLVITPNEVGQVDFVRDIYPTLTLSNEDVGEERIRGNLGNLRVSLGRNYLTVTGSLCKWLLGDNYQTMSRNQIKQSIEALSESLSLPMDKAKVTRIDFGASMIVKNPVNTYLNHLGTLRYFERCPHPHTLYYALNSDKKRLCFYDKVEESRMRRESISENYRNSNILRYEQRFKAIPHKFMGLNRLTGEGLFREENLNILINQWLKAYENINKINNISMDIQKVKTPTLLKDAGIVAFCNNLGGELSAYNWVDEQRKSKRITNKQAFDLRRVIKRAFSAGSDFTKPNEAIEELNNTISKQGEYLREISL